VDHPGEVHVLIASRGFRLPRERVGLRTYGDKRRVPASFLCLEQNETMKLLRDGLSGQKRPGLLDSDGCIRDLSRDVADIGPPDAAGLAGLAKLKWEVR
jgi:hypothetical protein